jgi:hypothetical protein
MEMRFMHDTTPEAEEVYYAMLAAMPPERRFAQANSLSVRMRSTALASIRAQYPDYSDYEVKRVYFRRIMTPEEFKTNFPEA